MQIGKIASMLHNAQRIAVLCGAGLSKASGIPTYRDEGGLWTQEGIARFSSIDEFQRDPQGFHAFWAQRRREMASAKPNAGHLALAQLQHLKSGLTLITQNIDGLLPKAGARAVMEVHGSLARDKCTACRTIFSVDQHSAKENGSSCPACGASNVRPDVVMFGEALDPLLCANAEYAAKISEVFLLIGTSAVVYPAAGWAEKAWSRGAKLAIINLESTPFDEQAEVVINGRAEETLPRILEQMRSIGAT